MTWTDICAIDDLLPDRGVAALVGGEQIAVFRLSAGPVLAIANTDPLGGANVLSRGLVGTRGDRAVVFSPLHKQAFDLVTGECLDAPGVRVATYPARIHSGRILIGPVKHPAGSAATTAAGVQTVGVQAAAGARAATGVQAATGVTAVGVQAATDAQAVTGVTPATTVTAARTA